jgi:hypothetical protein
MLRGCTVPDVDEHAYYARNSDYGIADETRINHDLVRRAVWASASQASLDTQMRRKLVLCMVDFGGRSVAGQLGYGRHRPE